MRAVIARSTIALLAVVAGGSGACRASPLPEERFAEAERLRVRYEEPSSRQAIAAYREAMAAWDRSSQPAQAARAAHGAGLVFWQLGLLPESLQFLRAALERAVQSGDRILESDIRSDLGTAAASAATPDAEQQCRTALERAKQAGARRGTAKALNCLGEAAYFAQDHDKSLAFHAEAGRLWVEVGDPAGQARTLRLQGEVYSDLSRFDEAHGRYESARSLWTAQENPRELAITLVADARLRMRRGEYQEALDGFHAALSRLEPMGDAVWEGAVLTGIARVHLDMGDMGTALEYWERALRVFDAAGLKVVSVDVLMSLGQTYLASGAHAAAFERFERALTLAIELSNERWRALALRNLGAVYLFRRQPHAAAEHLQRALDAQRGVDDPRLAAETRADLGAAHNLLGDRAAAASHFEAALALSRAAGDRVSQARSLFGLARAALGRHDLVRGRAYIEQALQMVESIRTAVENRDLRSSYFASVHDYHELHLDVLMRLDRLHPSRGLAAAAFEASEQARARSLIESLLESAVDLRAGVDQALLQREQQIRQSFEDWALRRRRLAGLSASPAAKGEMAADYRSLEERFNQVEAEIRHTSPRYAALVRPQPLRMRQVQREVLDARTLLLEYALGSERSYLWAISSDSHEAFELPPRDEIERSARRVHEWLASRAASRESPGPRGRSEESESDAEYWREAVRLSEMLLAPVARRLDGKRILVVPDGALHYVPFAALPLPGNHPEPVPLVVDHEVVILPSASALALVRRETAGRGAPPGAVAVLADPVFEFDDPRLRRLLRGGRPARDGALVRGPAAALARGQPQAAGAAWARDGMSSLPRLPSSRHEAEAIVAIAPAGQVFARTDFEASRAVAMSPDLASYRIVHFATHGVLDNENPGLSGIAFSMFDEHGRPQDGFLRLRDIYGLTLPVELVVLSACSTALGRPVRGEGLVGIVRGFMYAGAKRVIASIWDVDDEATSALMSRFYREILEQNLSPAAALRQAQLSLRQQDRWRSPYYWAGFVLEGEWR